MIELPKSLLWKLRWNGIQGGYKLIVSDGEPNSLPMNHELPSRFFTQLHEFVVVFYLRNFPSSFLILLINYVLFYVRLLAF